MCHLSPLATTKAGKKSEDVGNFSVTSFPLSVSITGEHLLIFGTDYQETVLALLFAFGFYSEATVKQRDQSWAGSFSGVQGFAGWPRALSPCQTEGLTRRVSKCPGIEGGEQAGCDLVSRSTMPFLSFFSKMTPTDTHKTCEFKIGGLSCIPLFFPSHKL